jgi:hypothetical protein
VINAPFKYEIGTFFSTTDRLRKVQYWKIIEHVPAEKAKNQSYYSRDKANSYKMARCNKKGTDLQGRYKTTECSYINERLDGDKDGWQGEKYEVLGIVDPNKKAQYKKSKKEYAEGARRGEIKRRIGYLEARIAQDQKELEKLMNELVELGWDAKDKK